MDASPLFVAIDLGAGSGRVFLAGPGSERFLLEEISRFQYPPGETNGHLRWDMLKIFEEIKTGLRGAIERAVELQRPIQSVGVDSWGVDFGLIDASGRLIEQPVCYRDNRTNGRMERVFEEVSRAEIFSHTGIQFLSFNTMFQLHALVEEGLPAASAKLLLIPDVINLFLTGQSVTEYTNATTTQMLNATSRTWDVELLERLGLPLNLLAEVIPSGSEVGPLTADVFGETQRGAIKVVAPATHDTGSAVAGAPLKDHWAYISSGTWSLVGVERDDVLINSEVATHNFTNEGGAFGTIRLLKNVMGLWLLESCRKEWKARGEEIEYGSLLDQIEALDGTPALIFPDDPRFLNPPSMLQAIATQLGETGQSVPDSSPKIAKVILDSLALRYASVLRTIASLTKQKVEGIHIIGGGSQNNYLNQATANVTGLPVLAGPVEATVIGNILVQAIAAGLFDSLREARKYVASKLSLKEYCPESSAGCTDLNEKYATIEGRYVN